MSAEENLWVEDLSMEDDVGVDEEGVEEDARADVLGVIEEGCRGATFPAAGEDTFITVPFVFE